MTHIGSGYAAEADASLDVLSDLVESHPDVMAPFAIFIKVCKTTGEILVKQMVVWVAQWRFSGSIPLSRHLQRFGKMTIMAVSDKD